MKGEGIYERAYADVIKSISTLSACLFAFLIWSDVPYEAGLLVVTFFLSFCYVSYLCYEYTEKEESTIDYLSTNFVDSQSLDEGNALTVPLVPIGSTFEDETVRIMPCRHEAV